MHTLKIQQPEFLTVTVAYNRLLQGFVNVDELHPIVAVKIRDKEVQQMFCPCGCGNTCNVIPVELFNKIIEALKVQRLSDSN